LCIAHLTSAHPRFDTRIFFKECRSLAKSGRKVVLIVADGLGDGARDGVAILDVGKRRGRFARITTTVRRMLARAVAIDADAYHIHDPELVPAGLALKRRGKAVIFDAHEDLPAQIMGKAYLPKASRSVIAAGMAVLERFACRRLDGVIAATPFIRDKFRAMGIRSVDVNNYPMLGELESEAGWAAKRDEICYIGNISAIRGNLEIVKAMRLVANETRLNLAGRMEGVAIAAAMRAEAGWTRVKPLGFLDRDGVRDVLTRSVAGLVTLHPVVNYLDSLPVKMFEYMSAGIPVIASDFPLWREIVAGNDCGILVDPLDPAAIAAAIDRLVGDRALAQRLGANGRRAVLERYNWAIEEQKLFEFYAETGI
jgi:glycosyltransferase involved in cell wall biosynthesis